jgi:hypothetical protein
MADVPDHGSPVRSFWPLSAVVCLLFALTFIIRVLTDGFTISAIIVGLAAVAWFFASLRRRRGSLRRRLRR